MKWLEKVGVALPILKWPEPRAVTELEWRSHGLPRCKEVLALFWKFGLGIGVPVLVSAKIWLPAGFVPAAIALTLFCSLVPLASILSVWVQTKVGVLCVINKNGVGKSVGWNSSLCEWENIISYWFRDHPDLSDVRVLVATVNDEERQFCFAPDEISEVEIQELLKEHLHK